ncbi:glutaredoxin [Cylindrobasidium torrendii FP15055 ss-10]|uniref:glutathione peroxidase n=1 Tax=Cylindrobasidium torrendii FP15055 ss-10 TaxID=1314674 RepID=A0A0D7B6G2_9AGAR|nr:glutaredoxin [Cylindrobasidium torrendii FP15055 ss-10]
MFGRLSGISRYFSSAGGSSSAGSQNQQILTAVKDLVEETVTSNRVAIFSKSYCPYCTQAKTLFKEKYPDAQTTVIELDERDDGGHIQDYLAEKTGQYTVPNVFINSTHLGGCDDTLAAFRSGKLATMLKSA